MDDVDHPVDLLGGDGSCPALLSQQVHHVAREFTARLLPRFRTERKRKKESGLVEQTQRQQRDAREDAAPGARSKEAREQEREQGKELQSQASGEPLCKRNGRSSCK